MEMEIRSYQSKPTSNQTQRNRVFGIAAPFNIATKIPDVRGNSFGEIIRPGAFQRSIDKGDIRLFRDHNKSILLGRLKSGTLQLRETPEGLYFECDLPDSPDGHNARVAIERGDLDGCSFGFTNAKMKWTRGADGPLCELMDVDIHEISLVSMPAYKVGTRVDLRSIQEFKPDFSIYRMKLKILQIDTLSY